MRFCWLQRALSRLGLPCGQDYLKSLMQQYGKQIMSPQVKATHLPAGNRLMLLPAGPLMLLEMTMGKWMPYIFGIHWDGRPTLSGLQHPMRLWGSTVHRGIHKASLKRLSGRQRKSSCRFCAHQSSICKILHLAYTYSTPTPPPFAQALVA